MSEETNCFSADVYLDNKKVGLVKNAGHGGCNFYYWIDPKNGNLIKTWADKQKTEFDFEKLDQIVDKLLVKSENLNWLKKQTKKKTLYHLKGDKKGSWGVVKMPFDGAIKEYLIKKYSDKLKCIANEDLEKAVEYC